MIYKEHKIEVRPFGSKYVVNISGPLVGYSRAGTFDTHGQALVYAKRTISEAQREPTEGKSA